MSNAASRSIALSFYTFLSRILGLLRDHFMAVSFGTGMVASAFSVGLSSSQYVSQSSGGRYTFSVLSSSLRRVR
ncbi:hypothetical protein LEP1GSC151_0610 [Leptospira interrogans serovar Grippotyphosa str. LT2186]|uniref:Uncharacterized protein n=1 Tax=Leptospira interrogans serovar Grippotyphosa str. LT2186 TaxID=1001599 RepID=M3H6Q4_LEPIR|nr:hypothetical protein LEP1GSC151_0610 [Leptospira interrogans serovar Grippotyphosa str. LT2186]